MSLIWLVSHQENEMREKNAKENELQGDFPAITRGCEIYPANLKPIKALIKYLPYNLILI